MTSNNSGFSIIPNSIFDNDDVKDFALLVLIILHCYKDNKNQVNMSLNEIVTSEKVFSSNIYTIIK